jgi:hypothetical protein
MRYPKNKDLNLYADGIGGTPLKAIRIRAVLSTVIFGVCLTGCGLFFAFELFLQDSGARALFIIFLAAGTAFAVLGLWAYHALKIARLIVENSILHIRPLPGSRDGAFLGESGADVYVSYFGMLFGAKLIRFYPGGVRLKAVTLRSGCVCLTYGTDKKTKEAKFFCEPADDEALEKTARKFCFETGVVPVISDKRER